MEREGEEYRRPGTEEKSTKRRKQWKQKVGGRGREAAINKSGLVYQSVLMGINL